MFGITLTPAWGAVAAILVLGAIVAFTHIVSIRIGD